MSQINGKNSVKTNSNEQKASIQRPNSRQSSSINQAATANTVNQNQNKNIVLNRSRTYLISPNSNEENINANKQAQPKTPVKTAIEKNPDKNENIKVPSVKPASLSEFKQQKRAEIQSKSKVTTNSPKSDVVVSNTRSIETIIMKGRQSGSINLSDFGLQEMPSAIWNLIDKEKQADYSLENTDFKWWDAIELSKLILASNKIKSVPKDIKCLSSLTTLDIHDNILESVDDSIGELSLLQNLNLSHNQLKTLPNKICELRRLINLNLSHNQLNALPKLLGQIDDLEDLDLSNNLFENLPNSFAWFTKLRRLQLQKNLLKTLSPEIFNSTHLKIIDISENQIEELPKQIGELVHIEQLYARQNKLKNLPYLEKCCKLKDWDVSFNKIKEIDDNCFDNLVSLVNFNLRDNQIDNLPKTIMKLQLLERLDLSNNNLSSLPCELGGIECLKQLLLVGNPLRTIRKDIISRGADAILKHLRNHLNQDLNTSAQDLEENMLRSDVIKSTKIFDLSGKKLTNVTSNMIAYCKQSTALVLNLSKNSLQDLPDELEVLAPQLNELNLSLNRFQFVPKAVFLLANLVTLDLRGNHLSEISNEISKLKSLRELTIADNRLTEMPPGVYDLPILENLFCNNNHIKTIDPFKIIAMKFLSTLSLQNNDITQVPIELGKAEQIRSLQLEGNPFRLPSQQVLAKGTVAILEYLRGRMA